MSLSLEVKQVFGVLLADGWHTVADQSFDLDAYEYWQGGHMMQKEGVPATGAKWTEPDGTMVVCPLISVLAVRLVAGPASK